MICDIFYEKKLDFNLGKSRFDVSFVSWLIATLIFKNGPQSLEEIYIFLETYFGNTIKISKLKIFLEEKFILKRKIFLLPEEYKRVLEQFPELIDEIKLLSDNFAEDYLINVVNTECFSNSDFDLIKAFKYIFAIILKKVQSDYDLAESNLFSCFLNLKNNITLIKSKLDCINEHYLNLPINTVFNNQLVLKFFYLNNVNSVRDLTICNPHFLICLFSIDPIHSYEIFNNLTMPHFQTIESKLKSFFYILNEKEKYILFKRKGVACEAKTLEEIGKELGLTRERVRQIESKSEKKLLKNFDKISIDLYAVFFYIAGNSRLFLEFVEFRNFFKSEEVGDMFIYLVSLFPLYIKCDYDIEIIYNSNSISLEEIENNFLGNNKNAITLKTFNILKNYEKNFVKKNYRLTKQHVYIKRGLSFNYIISFILDENFQNGYRIGSKNDYEKLKNICFQNFDVQKNDFPSLRAMTGLIERLDYCQIDKGTYKNRNFCISIPSELREKIISYILSNGPTVFYISIFEEFKDELLNLGINNYFYLKGLLDPLLPHEVITKRNYLSFVEDYQSGRQMMIEYIKKFERIFDLSNIKEHFKGVKNYTIFERLYSEKRNGLLFLGDNRFVYYDKLNISSEMICHLKSIIEEVFCTLKTNTISAKKIYNFLAIKKPDLFYKLKILFNSFSLFSLIEYIFSNYYNFNRPYVSKENIANLNKYTLISDYASSLNYFNAQIISEYIRRMSLGTLYSYQSFMEDMSENFVQIDKDTMIKKELFALNEKQAADIKQSLYLFINRFNCINTESFSTYDIFPYISFHWNKYLLVGIIRTYFSDIFNVSTITSNYRTCDFIITISSLTQ